jgi:hypothetical protein
VLLSIKFGGQKGDLRKRSDCNHVSAAFKATPTNVPVEAGRTGCAPPNPDRPLNPRGVKIPVLVSNPTRRSFWMIAKLSSIVIMNLIANLPFLYHNLETAGDLH